MCSRHPKKNSEISMCGFQAPKSCPSNDWIFWAPTKGSSHGLKKPRLRPSSWRTLFCEKKSGLGRIFQSPIEGPKKWVTDSYWSYLTPFKWSYGEPILVQDSLTSSNSWQLFLKYCICVALWWAAASMFMTIWKTMAFVMDVLCL